MVELCLMAASTAYPSGLFRQEQGLQRATKELRTFSSVPGVRQEMIRSGSLQIKPHLFEDPWKSTAQLLSSDKSVKLDPTIRGPVLINVQDARYESMIVSLGIAEQCRRHDKTWQSFMSASSEAEEEELDLSQMSGLTGFQTLPYMHQQPLAPLCGKFLPYSVGDDEAHPSLIYPQTRIYLQKPILDFVGDLACKSLSAMHPDGQVLLAGNKSEMKDIQSIFSEFCLPKSSTKCGDRAMVVPYFSRLDMRKRRTKIQGGSALQLEAVTATPVKSPRKTKLKQSSKRKSSSNAGSETDIHRRNYFHACESLLSLVLGNREEKSAIQSLQKSGPELPQLLTQFSASIAGTGLAVLFSVVCKVACGRVPISSSKLLNTGFGFGLVWLSWAVNKLRDNIIDISKNPSKLGLKDEEMMRKVDSSVKEIFFRAATLMAVVVLRIA